MTRPLAALVLCLVALAAPAGADDAGPGEAALRRGPVEARDEWLLAQGVLSLPPVPPDALSAGRTELRLDGDWGSDFGFRSGPGGHETDLRYIVDGEHRSGALTVRRGLGWGLTAGLHAPVEWRGPGLMDGIIDWFHGRLHLPDGGRSFFPDGRLRVEGRDGEGRPLAWGGRTGAGLGKVELELRKAFSPDADRGLRFGIDTRLSLPTATGTFGKGGVEGGLQLVLGRSLGARADLWAGGGLVTRRKGAFEGVAYAPLRPQGFLAVEGRLKRAWSVAAQVEAAGRLVKDVDAYPATTIWLRVVTRVGVGRWTVEGGATEGLVNQDATTDFGILLNLGRRF